MCDEHTAEDNANFLAAVSRRQFGTMAAKAAGAAGLIAMLPTPADAKAVNGKTVAITTPDGTADAYWVAPQGAGSYPGVLIWPDIMGLRPAFMQMADRLAQSGYAVLCVNQFYRSTKAPFLQPGESYDQPAVREKIAPMVKALSPDGTVRDAKVFTAFIDAQPQTDHKKGLATTGYCMGGPMVFRTAAAVPDRVRAGATFHGGGLVSDTPDSPHLLIPQMKAQYLIAIAANDDARSPGDKTVLRDAFAKAKLPAEIEVYDGTMHGWCPPDSRVYNMAQAEKAWNRMLALFDKTLV
ncbi:dienelactone hydrolase family protein [Sphingomonas oligophenolica]|uniref:Dienelactone hydrolase family protein n=1 Tax=Sphingomonas oligophenolica TaxID=301154 RepID=A0A502CR69_9SPHN|nr:dienelactone hydrolase family protein [Sphingomonas oligophenolica]TPG15323.1 dienelactone hydrolase family protein [Sphingomonas oligophenolica]